MIDVMSHKWDAIYAQLDVESSLPVSVLTENEFLLPKVGTALDLACGLGANALFLAHQGMAVTAWDISIVAIDKLSRYATQQDLNINLESSGVTMTPSPEGLSDSRYIIVPVGS